MLQVKNPSATSLKNDKFILGNGWKNDKKCHKFGWKNDKMNV